MLLTAVAGLKWISQAHRSRTASDAWETHDGSMRLRIARYDEINPISGPGFYYVLESMPQGSHAWKEAMVERMIHDIPIPRDQLQFLGEGKACFYVHHVFAATTDGGATWAVWDALAEAKRAGFFTGGVFIKEVKVGPDGKGVIALVPRSVLAPPIPDALTTDYGMHWEFRER
jgi:hypothetical protein